MNRGRSWEATESLGSKGTEGEAVEEGEIGLLDRAKMESLHARRLGE